MENISQFAVNLNISTESTFIEQDAGRLAKSFLIYKIGKLCKSYRLYVVFFRNMLPDHQILERVVSVKEPGNMWGMPLRICQLYDTLI